MKLIEPKIEIIPQESDIDGIFKQIELAGRTCYKSEDKITDTSSKDFVQKMIDNNHTSMLEHGSVYLFIPWKNFFEDENSDTMYSLSINKYSKYDTSKDYSMESLLSGGAYITTNYRVLYENRWLHLLKYCCEPTTYHDKRITVRFTCDRGVSHELVRHRVFSFAQESTRYCNYSKDKFNNEITFIIPQNLNLNEGKYNSYKEDDSIIVAGDGYYFDIRDGFTDESIFIYHLLNSESRYLALLDMGWKPQQARQILPNALKTEVVMTGFLSDWKKFLELRTAPNAHPDMQYLAKKLQEELEAI